MGERYHYVDVDFLQQNPDEIRMVLLAFGLIWDSYDESLRRIRYRETGRPESVQPVFLFNPMTGKMTLEKAA